MRRKQRLSHADKQDHPNGPGTGERAEISRGAIALPDGSVILVEMRRQTLSQVTPNGQVEIIAELGGGPNGAAVGPDGPIYVANNGGPEWITDGQGTVVVAIVDEDPALAALAMHQQLRKH